MGLNLDSVTESPLVEFEGTGYGIAPDSLNRRAQVYFPYNSKGVKSFDIKTVYAIMRADSQVSCVYVVNTIKGRKKGGRV
jgi:hypothetical protein